VKCGVPQGSVLGPLLFCLYINDLPLHLSEDKVRADFFADDSSLHTSGKSIESIQSSLQTSMTEVKDWCSVNCMVIHPTKTKSMVVTTRQKHQREPLTLKLYLDKDPIEQVKEHRILGVQIDQELKWESQIAKTRKKISKNLFLLSKLKHYATFDTLKMFHNAHIMPHINYASTLWDGASNHYMKHLNSLHRRSAKIILSGEEISTDDKLKKLNILPLNKQLKFNKAVMMYKVFNNQVPIYFSENFQRANDRYGSSNFLPPRPRTDLFKTSFVYSGTSVWNSLPSSLKNASSLRSFKNMLLKHIGGCQT